MKRFVVVENPPRTKGARSVPMFRPVVFSGGSAGLKVAGRARRNKGKLTRKQIAGRACWLPRAAGS